MVGLYLCVLILICMIAYAGVEGTMRVFTYMDLTLRFQVVKVRLWWMKRRLEKDLGLPPTDFSSIFKEIDQDD